MAYARKHASRNGKRKWEKEIVHFGLEIYSNATWDVGEQGSLLDFNIKVYIHYSTAQTGVHPGVGPHKETAFCYILLLNASICATEGEQ